MENFLNNAKDLKNIQSNYFVRMMLPESEVNAIPYVQEESTILDSIIESITNFNQWNFIVIGSGSLWYIEKSLNKANKYIAIEPQADIFIPKQIDYILKSHPDIHVINKNFGEFHEEELSLQGNSIFVFHFNILSYIPNPIDKINQYLKKGDILYISTWSKTKDAKRLRKKYFDYINGGFDTKEFMIDPEKPLGLCNLDAFDFQKLKYYTSHKRIKGTITDILIINC